MYKYMKLIQIKNLFIALLTCFLLQATTVNAAAVEETFADKKVVLQISDPNPFKQTLVLNVAGNLIKHYGLDGVAIEIVAFGPGLRLLQEANNNKGRIGSLASNGVKFSACANTIRAFTKKLGEAPVLNANAVVVPGGVVRIMDLVDSGYILIKP